MITIPMKPALLILSLILVAGGARAAPFDPATVCDLTYWVRVELRYTVFGQGNDSDVVHDSIRAVVNSWSHLIVRCNDQGALYASLYPDDVLFDASGVASTSTYEVRILQQWNEPLAGYAVEQSRYGAVAVASSAVTMVVMTAVFGLVFWRAKHETTKLLIDKT